MANEKRLTDANALMDAFRRYMVERYDKEKCFSEENCKTCEKSCLWRKIVSVAPTVDAAPVVHGRWEKEDQSGISIDGYMVCSVCNVMIPKADYNRYCLHRLNFCPNCGAKMDGGDGDGNK